MKCKLCNQEKQLISKSHIIPEFLYKRNKLYDDKHRMTKFKVEDLKVFKKLKQVQSGIYEGDLLCSECDNVVIGKLELYASKALFGGELEINECPDCMNFGNETFYFSYCKYFNYKKFKLFILAILYKAAISTKSEFSEIVLTDQSLERLKNMILKNDPGKENDYPIMIATFVSTSIPTDFILAPIKVNKDGFDQFIFIIGGIVYCIYDSVDVTDTKIEPIRLKENGDIVIHHFDDTNAEVLLRNYMGI